jgi:hypothetical protein
MVSKKGDQVSEAVFDFSSLLHTFLSRNAILESKLQGRRFVDLIPSLIYIYAGR